MGLEAFVASLRRSLILSMVVLPLALGPSGASTVHPWFPGKEEAAREACCRHYHNQDWEAFSHCVIGFKLLSSCGLPPTGCMYNGWLYPEGAVVALHAYSCIKLVCVAVPPNQGNQTTKPTLYEVRLQHHHSYCGCCEHGGVLYGDGEWTHKDPFKCIRSICKNGKWVDRDEEGTCCPVGMKFCVDGEEMFLHDCISVTCKNGVIKYKSYNCCCIEDKKIYECGSTLPRPDECTNRVCENGTVITYDNHGCCIYNGEVYNNGEEFDHDKIGCNWKRCEDGVIKLKRDKNCCRFKRKWVQNGTIVVRNDAKCILKLCSSSEIVDLTLDQCDCCFYENRMQLEGTVIKISSCLTHRCVKGTWVTSNNRRCSCCHVYDDPHIWTWDNQFIDFYGHCNYTLTQASNKGYATSWFITLSFKKCPVPFSRGKPCNDVLVVKHNEHIVVTVHRGGLVTINGKEEELPYSPHGGPFVWQSPFSIGIVTQNGIAVEYHLRHFSVLRLHAPSSNKGHLFGLCGQFNGIKGDDLLTRHPSEVTNDVYAFGNSWKTQKSGCDDSTPDDMCESFSQAQLDHFDFLCVKLFTHSRFERCPNVKRHLQNRTRICIPAMCNCAPTLEEICIRKMQELYEEECLAQGGELVEECDPVNCLCSYGTNSISSFSSSFSSSSSMTSTYFRTTTSFTTYSAMEVSCKDCK